MFPFRASFRLDFFAELLVIDHRHDFGQRSRVIAAIEYTFDKVLADDAGRNRVGIWLDQIDAANFRNIHFQLSRSRVDHAFHYEHALRTTRAANRRDHHFIGKHHGDLGVEVGNVVVADRMRLGIEWHGHHVGVVGTRVVIENVLETQDLAFFGQGNFGIVHLVAFGGRRQEIFAAVFVPFDRPVQAHGQFGQQHIVRHGGVDFWAKTTASERGDHPHLVFEQPHAGSRCITQRDGRLRAAPDRHHLGLFVPVDHDTPIFECCSRNAIHIDLFLDDHIRLCSCFGVITAFLYHMGCLVGRQILMHQRSAGLERLLKINYGVQWFKIRVDIVAGIFGDVAGFSNDYRDRLARIAHFILGNRHERTG